MDKTKKISLKEVSEHLLLGFSKYQKEDMGFGSIEEYYSLTPEEARTLMSHPKVQLMKVKLPTIVIIDDLGELVQDTVPTVTPVSTKRKRRTKEQILADNAKYADAAHKFIPQNVESDIIVGDYELEEESTGTPVVSHQLQPFI